jgi:hypothetical protein
MRWHISVVKGCRICINSCGTHCRRGGNRTSQICRRGIVRQASSHTRPNRTGTVSCCTFPVRLESKNESALNSCLTGGRTGHGGHYKEASTLLWVFAQQTGGASDHRRKLHLIPLSKDLLRGQIDGTWMTPTANHFKVHVFFDLANSLREKRSTILDLSRLRFFPTDV